MRSIRPLTGFALAFIVLAAAAHGQSATLSAPAQVAVGAEILVTWTGPAAQGDFISVDLPGAPDREYGPYEYASQGSPLTLRAPGEPGPRVIRYHSGESGYPVLATALVAVVPATATLTAPATAGIGEQVSVTWSGPDHRGDFISVDPAGAPDKEYGRYVYLSSGSPVTIAMPNEAGSYEVRYHLGVPGYAVIGRAPIEVGDIQATLEFEPRIQAGGTLSVSWQGPGNVTDFISVDPVGAEDREYGRYVYVQTGNPIEIPVPEEPGTYLVRYHIGTGDHTVIGEGPIEVGGVSATLAVPAPIIADESFDVEWTGPDNDTDFITIVPVGTPDGEYDHYAYTRRGNPLRIRSPLEPGAYELRYLSGREYFTLAAIPVEVLPGRPKGTLKVFLSSADVAAGDADASSAAVPGAVEVILDASGSMLQRLDGTRRIELARNALLELTGEALPADVPFALRVFGHREADSCRTDLEIPLGPLDRSQAATTLRSVNAMNLAKTPIADSLRQVRSDLAGASGEKLVILVTDGEETCDGDPASVIEELAASGFDVRVNIVGFAIEELMVKEEFERWARLGGGRYFDAADGDALAGAVRGALATTFEVLQDGAVIATGSLGGGEGLELDPGTYQVRIAGRDVGEATVVAKEETNFVVDG